VSARLLFRVDPVAGESPRGYLCRTAHDHGYSSPNALAQIAGLWVSGTGKVTGLDQDGAIKQLSHALRLEPEEWRSMCYCYVKGRNRFKQRSFYGETISADDLNYRNRAYARPAFGSARSGGPFGISGLSLPALNTAASYLISVLPVNGTSPGSV
jgi:hypothetical protein